eukprot:TRINITY_DN4710_c0_g1_i3.p1 TRINITY_DN4710_c0_g1~~TRINITY_DN4710_c0_g1_i3.p1  ORF type:complete len:292 (+),score=76.38 TRINITY_DN4710_c0_g1_i3:98-973(+)
MAIPGLSKFYEMEEYNGYFLDELTIIVKEGNMEIKYASLHCICKLLCCNYKAQKRKDIFAQLINLSKAKSYYNRMAFLLFCEVSVCYFSLNLLKSIGLFEQYFALMEDKISNVRLKIIGIVVLLWKFANEPLREVIQDKLNTLRNDRNKEVRYFSDVEYTILQEKTEELKKNDPEIAERNHLRELAEQELSEKEKQREMEMQQKVWKQQLSEKTLSTPKKPTGSHAKETKPTAGKSAGKVSTSLLKPYKAGGKKARSNIDLVIPKIGMSKRKTSGNDVRSGGLKVTPRPKK